MTFVSLLLLVVSPAWAELPAWQQDAECSSKAPESEAQQLFLYAQQRISKPENQEICYKVPLWQGGAEHPRNMFLCSRDDFKQRHLSNQKLRESCYMHGVDSQECQLPLHPGGYNQGIFLGIRQDGRATIEVEVACHKQIIFVDFTYLSLPTKRKSRLQTREFFRQNIGLGSTVRFQYTDASRQNIFLFRDHGLDKPGVLFNILAVKKGYADVEEEEEEQVVSLQSQLNQLNQYNPFGFKDLVELVSRNKKQGTGAWFNSKEHRAEMARQRKARKEQLARQKKARLAELRAQREQERLARLEAKKQKAAEKAAAKWKPSGFNEYESTRFYPSRSLDTRPFPASMNSQNHQNFHQLGTKKPNPNGVYPNHNLNNIGRPKKPVKPIVKPKDAVKYLKYLKRR